MVDLEISEVSGKQKEFQLAGVWKGKPEAHDFSNENQNVTGTRREVAGITQV